MGTNDMKIHGNYVAFWNGPFSNYYPCLFRVNRKLWFNSEQCFMWLKAKYFGDEETALAIESAAAPSFAKRLGREVKNFDEAKWQKVRYEKMYEAVFNKFSQNEDLRQELLSDKYKDKHFVEGSPYDKIWGVGIKWTDKAIADKDNWRGENLLGQVLDDVREKLKTEE